MKATVLCALVSISFFTVATENDNLARTVSDESTPLTLEELQFIANFSYYSVKLAQYDIQARDDYYRLLKLIQEVRNKAHAYAYHQETAHDLKTLTEQFTNTLAQRANCFHAWRACSQLASATQSPALQQFFNQLQELGRQQLAAYCTENQETLAPILHATTQEAERHGKLFLSIAQTYQALSDGTYPFEGVAQTEIPVAHYDVIMYGLKLSEQEAYGLFEAHELLSGQVQHLTHVSAQMFATIYHSVCAVLDQAHAPDYQLIMIDQHGIIPQDRRTEKLPASI